MPNVKCKICGKVNNDGINIFNIHICKKCEKEIVNTEVEDIKYDYYKSIFRKLWIDYILKTT
jgi:hypothetical protein